MKIQLFPLFAASLVMTILSPVVQADPVDELMEVMEMEKQMLGGFDAMMPMIDQMAVQFSLNDEGKAELKEIYKAWFDEDIDRAKLVKGLSDQYRQAFTAEEIEKMLVFFSSPTGKKVISKQSILMQEGAKLGMAEAQQKQALLIKRLQPFLEKHVEGKGAEPAE